MNLLDGLDGLEQNNEDVVDDNVDKIRDLVKRVEFSQLLPDDLKELIKGKAKETVVKGGVYEKLQIMFKEYEDFMREKMKIFEVRDKLLCSEIGGIPLWGGELSTYDGEVLPADNAAESIRWSREYLAPLFEGIISVPEAKKRMNIRMEEIGRTISERSEQIELFLEIRLLLMEEGIKNPLLSKVRFAKVGFKKRKGILLKISSLNGNGKKFKNLAEITNNGFFSEMDSLIEEAKASYAPEAWDIYSDMYQQFVDMGLVKKPLYKEWVKKAKDGMKKRETELDVQNTEARAFILQVGQQDIVSMQQKSVLTDYLDYIGRGSSVLKLKPGIGRRLIDSELQLREILAGEHQGELYDDHISRKEHLLRSQNQNEFLRRTFQQLAALAMCRGKTIKTAQQSQQTLVHNERSVSKETFNKRRADYLREQADKKGMKHSIGEEEDKEIDVVSAAGGASGDVHEGNLLDSKEAENHKMAYWEITRVSSLNLWPPEANERYLRKVKDSGQHMTLTNNHLVVRTDEAEKLLRRRLIENLDKLPGTTVKNKRANLITMFQMVDETENAGDDFVDNIFRHTKMEEMNEAA